ncbi:MAG: site-2 protease family protein [Anaerolineales bacterium]|nr:site-2 protease family protein [Anaerolineales bacterium]
MFDILLTVISFVLVLGVLVFFHELGHYWVARRNGIIVEEFGFGYPPRALKLFHYDGTDFTLNWLPLGGFARMKGKMPAIWRRAPLMPPAAARAPPP